MIHGAHRRADRDELAAIRALLDEAFDGDFGDDDWEHALGGIHVLVHEGDAWSRTARW